MIAALLGITAGLLVESLSPQKKIEPMKELESAGGAHD
jgi:hypothetical protein